MNTALAKYFLPEGILDYFDIVSDKIENDQVFIFISGVHFYLEERNMNQK
ncbi:hypothetical protein [Tenacibaculum finnmarkense]|nr:hypothetical protein [Tenacibaculum finnmarkense]MCD8417538.1 hypothetical protein [Tenacibaculum finnmarkense genomovar finnmarkense]